MADAPATGWSAKNDEAAIEAGFGSWADWVEHLETHTKAGKPRKRRRKICGAKIPKGTEGRSQVGTPCCLTAGAPASRSREGAKETGHLGWGRCGSHGGGSLIGTEHPSRIHGRRSRYQISGALGEAYKASHASLSLTEDIRLANAQVKLALGELPENCPTPRQFLDRIGSLLAALDSENAEKIADQMNAFREELEDVELHWKQIAMATKAQEQKRRLIDTDLKRITREHGPASWTDIMVIVDEFKGMLQGIVDKYVPDGERSRVTKEVSNFGGTGPAAGAIPDGFN